jgi:hypothetical protein
LFLNTIACLYSKFIEILIVFSSDININLKSLKLDMYYIFASIKFADNKIVDLSDIIPYLII